MKKFEIKVSIRAKYIVFIAFLILFISLINAYLTIQNQTRSLKEALIEKAKLTVRKLADDSKDAILTKDDLTLFTSVKNIMKEKDTLYAMILDGGGIPICHNDTAFLGAHKHPLADSVTKNAFKARGILIQDVQHEGQAGFDVSSVMMMDRRLIGLVRIGFSKKPIETALRNTTMRILAITVTGLIIGVLFTVLLTSYITGPIQVLMAGAQRISDGRLDQDIRIKQKDEFFVLADTFNAMQRSIKKMMSEIAEQEAMKRELQIAARIQNMLIPKNAPAVPGLTVTGYTLPATEIGGDYYDFFHVDEENLGAIVADVSGHGISAALIMVMLRTIFRTSLKDIRVPSGILALANKLLMGNIEEKFITMLYFNINHKERKLKMSVAGHWPLLWFRAGDKSVTEVSTVGVPIGIFDDPQFEDTEITLSSGDLIVGYTDGFIEIENAQKEQFGIRRMKEVVLKNHASAPDMIVKKIIEETGKFSSERARDDKTVVILKAD